MITTYEQLFESLKVFHDKVKLGKYAERKLIYFNANVDLEDIFSLHDEISKEVFSCTFPSVRYDGKIFFSLCIKEKNITKDRIN